MVWPWHRNNWYSRSTIYFIYLAVHHSELPTIITQGKVEMTNGYIGLRKSIEEAMSRAKIFRHGVNKTSHYILAVNFSPLGVQYFGTTPSNERNRFKPLLHKCDYKGSVDWGTWHFLRDLPLRAMDADGNILLETDWSENSWNTFALLKGYLDD